jgi:hypothetical protein
VVYDEGTDDEHVLRVPIHLRPARGSRRFRVAPDAALEVVK